jgi:uncharacterized protein (TIGR03437 family)
MRSFVFAALAGLLCTAAFGAQTPAAVSVVSGNGQLTCLICTGVSFKHPDPMVVAVTDQSGIPIPSTQVTWTLSNNGGAYFMVDGYSSRTATSLTGSDGTASIQFYQTQQVESTGAAVVTASTIIASAGGATTATFYETEAAGINPGPGTIDVQVNWSSFESETYSGTAGSAGQTFTVSVKAYPNSSAGIPNVALFLLNSDDTVGPVSTSVPSAYCYTQSGAGNYTVLTDSSGTATCTMMFGSVVGSSTVLAVVGGAQQTAGGAVDANFETGPAYGGFTVAKATLASLTIQSGNSQSAVEGTAFANPLAVVVRDSNGQLMSGVTVTFAATGPVTLSATSAVTSLSGVAQVTATAGASAGQATVTATAGGITRTFTLTSTVPAPTPAVLSIQNSADNNQTAVEGAAFAYPLAVIVTGSNGLVMSGVTVSFVSSGPVALSATSAVTNASGVAEVMATAGSTAGQATVTASVGVLAQVFSLTSTNPLPIFTAASFVSAADGQVGSISPCSMTAINTSSATSGGSGLPPVAGPLLYEVGADTVTFGTGASAMAAPIFSVSNISGTPQIVILVPCEVTPGTVPVTVTVNGAKATVNVTVLPASPGIFQSLQSDGVVRAVIERPDGSFAGPTNPARRGETVTAFVTGLGAVSPQISTNSLPIWNTPSIVNGSVIVGVNNEGSQLVTAQLSPDMIGVYYVEFVVPEDAPQTNNVPFSIGLEPAGSSQKYYSASGGSKIPVD